MNHMKTPFLCCCTIVAFVSVGVPTWSLLSQFIGACLATGVVSFVSWPLHRNECCFGSRSLATAVSVALSKYATIYTVTSYGIDYKFWSSLLWNFIHLLLFPFPCIPNNLPSTLFSNSLNQCSFRVRDQVSYLYYVLCTLIFTFL
jgi:hypothetical protein